MQYLAMSYQNFLYPKFEYNISLLTVVFDPKDHIILLNDSDP
jgi:hypothetical protein